jgi:anti-anti-sigma regulatory factor
MTLVEDAQPVSHACAVPVSDEHLWEVTARFLADGLAAGEHVVYFEDGTLDAVLRRLADDRVDVRVPLQRGQLAIVPTDATRALLRGPAADVLATADATIDEALGRGFPAVRLTAQAHSALDQGGLATMLAYESGMDGMLGDRPAQLLCLYDRVRFPEDAIASLRELHRHQIVSTAVYDDGLLRITSPDPYTARVAGEADHSNRPRIKRFLESALDQALRSPSSSPEITLDLSSLRFLDVAGAVNLVHAGQEFPSAHTLVLTGVRPGVLRLLDRCGAPFVEQLRVEPRGDDDPMADPVRVTS